MNRMYTKIIKGCIGCPHHCGEGEFCKHPDRERNHVVYDYPLPDDCPLPKAVEDNHAKVKKCEDCYEFHKAGLDCWRCGSLPLAT